jgi:hypothetical protein
MNSMDDTGPFCRTCGSRLASSAKFCDHCGKPVSLTAQTPIQAHPKNGGKAVWWVCGSLVAVVGIVLLCLALTGGLLWSGVIPLPEFLKANVNETAPDATPEAVIPAELIGTISPTGQPPEIVIDPIPTAYVPDVIFKGVSFSVDPALATNISAEAVAAVSGPDLPPWEIMPSYIKFSLEGYPLQGTFHKPIVMAFPLQEYYSSEQTVKETVDSLKQVMASKNPSSGVALPFLPKWNAAQIFHAAVKYLDFRNGSGVRYVTQYGQDIHPVNNSDLFYTYQGLTKDGLYYISVIMPVGNVQLPADGAQVPGGNYEAFANMFPSYIAETTEMLSKQPDDTFNPNLALLDAVIASIEVKP